MNEIRTYNRFQPIIWFQRLSLLAGYQKDASWISIREEELINLDLFIVSIKTQKQTNVKMILYRMQILQGKIEIDLIQSVKNPIPIITPLSSCWFQLKGIPNPGLN